MVLAALCCMSAPSARADRQEDAGLRDVLERAIASTRCDGHDDRFGSEVFFKLHEPQLRRIVSDATERVDILRTVYCEAHRVTTRYRDQDGIELRLTPELVLAVIDVESHFNRYAVSSAGAVGLMQVMPFWPRRLGVDNRLFGNTEFNVRMGCEILAYYMRMEHNDYRRALSRYNGSTGRREYPDRVLGRLADRWRG
jgi:soluble lytic murein transglycosylase-like protein